ncbi:MAG: helix-turn-helix domain-containing protein [Oscillospiraceae bacterium]|nr:helix-turn-helix domain-containing protein [Oscillospiraceae bacterium]
MQYEKNSIINVEEMMELLQVGKSTAYHLLASGEIKAFRIGRKWKIEKEAIYDYIRRRTEQSDRRYNNV